MVNVSEVVAGDIRGQVGGNIYFMVALITEEIFGLFLNGFERFVFKWV